MYFLTEVHVLCVSVVEIPTLMCGMGSTPRNCIGSTKKRRRRSTVVSLKTTFPLDRYWKRQNYELSSFQWKRFFTGQKQSHWCFSPFHALSILSVRGAQISWWTHQRDCPFVDFLFFVENSVASLPADVLNYCVIFCVGIDWKPTHLRISYICVIQAALTGSISAYKLEFRCVHLLKYMLTYFWF